MKRVASISQAGETIIEAGSNASCMYIVDQGLAGVWIKGKRVSELGCELHLRRAHPQQQIMACGAAGADTGGGTGGACRSSTFFGEVALVTNQKRTATVIAERECRLLKLSQVCRPPAPPRLHIGRTSLPRPLDPANGRQRVHLSHPAETLAFALCAGEPMDGLQHVPAHVPYAHRGGARARVAGRGLRLRNS